MTTELLSFSNPAPRARPTALGFLMLGCLMLWIVAGCQSDKPAVSPSSKRVDVQEFAAIRDGGDVVVLDVRTSAEFDAGHIPGAINLDVHSTNFVSDITALDRQGTYLVYCRSGRRSQTACDIMITNGFSHLFDLAPGINGWKAAGKPVE